MFSKKIVDTGEISTQPLGLRPHRASWRIMISFSSVRWATGKRLKPIAHPIYTLKHNNIDSFTYILDTRAYSLVAFTYVLGRVYTEEYIQGYHKEKVPAVYNTGGGRSVAAADCRSPGPWVVYLHSFSTTDCAPARTYW